ncbi:MAG TPA: hypothetical protein VFW75_15305 [Acetobacteraceae bacterium]|nr:hypothetical protein [Acetobacteraceae bacterium]
MAQERGDRASRRALLGAGLGALAAGVGARAASAQTTKLAQSVVMYQDHPKGDQKCSICAHFLPPNACQVVAGTISPNGWCGVFTPKQT